MRHFHTWLCIIFLCSITYVDAQNRKIDSLLNLSTKQADTTLIKTYNELTWEYRLLNANKAIEYGNRAIALSQKLKFSKGLAQAYNDLGIIYYDQQKFDTAIHLYTQAMLLRKKDNDKLGMARLYNKIGIVYQKKGDFSTALENQISALNFFTEVNNEIGIAYSLNNIGILNQNLGLLDEAIKYHLRSLSIKEKLKDNYGMAGSYVNIGNIYYLQEEYEKAKEFYVRCVTIARKIGDKEYLSNALNNLSRVQIKNREYPAAIQTINESLALRTSLHDTKGIVSCLNNMGKAYYEMSQYDKAIEVLERALEKGQGVASCKPDLIETYNTLSLVFASLKQYDNALVAKDSMAAIKETIFDNSLKDKFAELQTRYETLQKEQKIALLNKDNSIKALQLRNQGLELEQNLFELTQNKLALSEAQLNITKNQLELQQKNKIILTNRLEAANTAIKVTELNKTAQIQKLELNKKRAQIAIILGVFSFVILLGYLFYRRRYFKQKVNYQKALLQQQQQAAQNVLAAEERERKRLAQELHDGVGQIMSVTKMNMSAIEDSVLKANPEYKNVFEKTLSMIDQSCKEIRTISHQMMPVAVERSGFANAVKELVNKIDEQKLRTNLYIDDSLQIQDVHKQSILYRIVQECINNVVKHAHASQMDISITKEEADVSIIVEDNGIGFNVQEKMLSPGVGLENILSRVQYLKGRVEYDATENRGTVVAVRVPL